MWGRIPIPPSNQAGSESYSTWAVPEGTSICAWHDHAGAGKKVSSSSNRKKTSRSSEASFMRLSLGFALSCLAMGLFGSFSAATAQDKTGKTLLLALEESLQDVIKQTE